MDGSDSQRILISLARIEEHEKSTTEELKHLNHAIFGNGKPGLELRVDRIEEREKLKKWFWRLLGSAAIFALAGNAASGIAWVIRSMH